MQEVQETPVLSLGLGRSPRRGNRSLLKYSCLGNPMDRRAWWVTVHGVMELDKTESESEVAQSWPTLCNPMDCRLPGSSFHGIFRARVLEWFAVSFSRGSSRRRDRTWVSPIPGRCFYHLIHQGSPVLNKTEHTQNGASTAITGHWADQTIAAMGQVAGSHCEEGIGTFQCLQRLLRSLQCTKQQEAFLQGVTLHSVM